MAFGGGMDSAATHPFDKPLWLVAVTACAVAIASVPIFSHQEGLSHITQLVAVAAVGLAGLTVLLRVPRIHPAVIAYVILVMYWSWSYRSEEWVAYWSAVKLGILTVAVHIVIRSSRHLLLLLGVYAASGLIALSLNWGQITELRWAMEGQQQVRDSMLRFDGTFANANKAGIFAMNVTLCALIVYFNSKTRFRWPLLGVGLVAGVIIGGMSGSRKAMLGMLLIGMVVPLLGYSGGRAGLTRWIKSVMLGILALGAAIGILSQTPHLERLTRLTEGRTADGSADTRMYMAEAAVKVWSQSPIIGVGYRGFARASGIGTYSHTTFGEILANGGLIGLFLIGVFFFFPAAQLASMIRRAPDASTRRLAMGLIAFWALFLLNSVFSVQYESKDLIPLWAAICGWVQQYRWLPRARSARDGAAGADQRPSACSITR